MRRTLVICSVFLVLLAITTVVTARPASADHSATHCTESTPNQGGTYYSTSLNVANRSWVHYASPEPAVDAPSYVENCVERAFRGGYGLVAPLWLSNFRGSYPNYWVDINPSIVVHPGASWDASSSTITINSTWAENSSGGTVSGSSGILSYSNPSSFSYVHHGRSKARPQTGFIDINKLTTDVAWICLSYSGTAVINGTTYSLGTGSFCTEARVNGWEVIPLVSDYDGRSNGATIDPINNAADRTLRIKHSFFNRGKLSASNVQVYGSRLVNGATGTSSYISPANVYNPSVSVPSGLMWTFMTGSSFYTEYTVSASTPGGTEFCFYSGNQPHSNTDTDWIYTPPGDGRSLCFTTAQPAPGTLVARTWRDDDGDAFKDAGEPWVQNPSYPCSNGSPVSAPDSSIRTLRDNSVNNYFQQCDATGPKSHYSSVSVGSHGLDFFTSTGWEVTGYSDQSSCVTGSSGPGTVTVNIVSNGTCNVWFGTRLSAPTSFPRNPYLTTTRGDVHAGGGVEFGFNCATSTGNIRGQSEGAISSAEYVASATGAIINFGSAGSASGSRLTFGNDSSLGSSGKTCRPDLVSGAEDWISTNSPCSTSSSAARCYGSSPGSSTLRSLLQGTSPNAQLIKVVGNVDLGTSAITVNRRRTLYVVGDVTIRAGIAYNNSTSVARGDLPSLGIIATGNINIESSVGALDGYYVADADGNAAGSIDTCSNVTDSNFESTTATDTCAPPLTIRGLAMANSFKFKRSGDVSASGLTLGEEIGSNFFAILYLAPPPGFGDRVSVEATRPQRGFERPPLF